MDFYRTFDLKWTLKAALVAALAMAPGLSKADVTTIKDITLDVPDGFKVSTSNRGLLLKTPDEAVDVWVETYKSDSYDELAGEHSKYWDKHSVLFNGDGYKTSRASGEVSIDTVDYDKATWKGAPTVLRYISVGPFGPDKKIVLVTYWATPSGDKEFWPQLSKTIDTLSVKVQY